VLNSRSSQDSANLLSSAINAASTPESSQGSNNQLTASNQTTVAVPISTVVVSNLPKLLFSNDEDLHPLLYPFGSITKLEVLDSAPQQDAFNALVEFTTLASAMDAKAALHGQIYAGHRLSVEHVQTGPSKSTSVEKNLLNPFASPFVVKTRALPSGLLAPTSQFHYSLQQNASPFCTPDYNNVQSRKLQAYRSLNPTGSQYNSFARYPSSYHPSESQAWSRSSSASSRHVLFLI
jgi:RNA recognition motif-containing protein